MPQCFLFSLIIIVSISGACGVSNRGERSNHGEGDGAAAGLLFAGVDAKLESSVILHLDVAQELVSEVSQGQSGDPLLVQRRGRVFLFNRTPGNTNFRELHRHPDHFELGNQIKTEAALAGDPHDVLLLDDDVLLAANYVTGALERVRISDGKTLGRVAGAWDRLGAAPFRPEALMAVERDGKTYVLVLHQGFDASYIPNGTQQVFVLLWEKDELQPVTTIPLQATAPVGFFQHDQNSATIVGLCSRFANDDCHAAIERIDLATFTAKEVFDFGDDQYFFNGPTTAGRSSDEIYANVEVAEGAEVKRRVVRFDLAAQKVKTIHEFKEAEFSGYWGTFYNQASNQLLVGDRRDLLRGVFSVYQDDDLMTTINVDAIPYSGFFLSGKN